MRLFSEVIQDPALQPDKTAFYKAQVTSIPTSRCCCCCCSFYVAVAVLLSASNQLSALLALLFMLCWRNVKVLSPTKHKVAKPENGVCQEAGDIGGVTCQHRSVVL